MMSHANHYEIVSWDDDRALAAGAVGEIRALRDRPRAVAVHPEQAAVDRLLPRRRRRADELRPAFRQQTLPLPHPVLQVEQSDARPVARRAVVVPAHQEVAVRIRFLHLPPDADAIEKRALWIRQ